MPFPFVCKVAKAFLAHQAALNPGQKKASPKADFLSLGGGY